MALLYNKREKNIRGGQTTGNYRTRVDMGKSTQKLNCFDNGGEKEATEHLAKHRLLGR